MISNIYDNLKTGDIILFKCNTLPIIGAFLTYGYFSHIGMVVKKKIYKNDLYISETNPAYEYLPSDYNKEKKITPLLSKNNGWRTQYGSDLLPLLVRIKYYPGECFIMRLNKPLDEKKENILFNILSESCPYPTLFKAIKIFIKEKMGYKDTSARHCFQHVGDILDKIGLTNNISSNNSIISICNEISSIPEKDLNDGFKYEPIKRIIYDI